jgi:tetratricopeptide (TPR) repeat protein
MSAFSSWFRSKPDVPAPKSVGNWEREVLDLLEEAKHTPRAFQGTPLNRAGDMCLRAGDRDRALTYYGQAIDALLEDGQREAARGVANKIIRVHPEAVRTLCTLTWLDLAAQHMATALLHLRDYVVAAKRVHRERLAGDQILEMARSMTQGEFLEAAADAMDHLGFPGEAALVREWSAAGGSPNSLSDFDAVSEHCMHRAVGSNARRKDEGAPA